MIYWYQIRKETSYILQAALLFFIHTGWTMLRHKVETDLRLLKLRLDSRKLITNTFRPALFLQNFSSKSYHLSLR